MNWVEAAKGKTEAVVPVRVRRAADRDDAAGRRGAARRAGRSTTTATTCASPTCRRRTSTSSANRARAGPTELRHCGLRITDCGFFSSCPPLGGPSSPPRSARCRSHRCRGSARRRTRRGCSPARSTSTSTALPTTARARSTRSTSRTSRARAACAPSSSRITTSRPPGSPILVRKVVPDIEVFGGIDLNLTVGGINPAAVEHMTRVSGGWGRIVWMSDLRRRESGALLERESAVRQRLARRRAAARGEGGHRAHREARAGAGHRACLAPQEALMLLREGQRQGVQHMVVTHAMNAPVLMDVRRCRKRRSSARSSSLSAARWRQRTPRRTVDRFADAIRKVGPEFCILSSDLGQQGNRAASRTASANSCSAARAGIHRTGRRPHVEAEPRQTARLAVGPRVGDGFQAVPRVGRYPKPSLPYPPYLPPPSRILSEPRRETRSHARDLGFAIFGLAARKNTANSSSTTPAATAGTIQMAASRGGTAPFAVHVDDAARDTRSR